MYMAVLIIIFLLNLNRGKVAHYVQPTYTLRTVNVFFVPFKSMKFKIRKDFCRSFIHVGGRQIYVFGFNSQNFRLQF